jgi:hypothetical protein
LAEQSPKDERILILGSMRDKYIPPPRRLRHHANFPVLNISWNIIVDVGYQFDSETGKQKRVQKWFTVQGTKRDAEKKLTELLHDLHRRASTPAAL